MVFIVLISVLSLLILIIFQWFKNKFNYWSSKGVANSKDLSIFGNYKNFIMVKCTECEITDKEYWNHENLPYCGLYFFWKPQILIRDSDMVKRILIKDFEYFTDHAQISSTFHGHDAVLHNIFFMKGKAWKNRKTAMSFMFTPAKLKNIVDPTYKICAETIENLNMNQKDFNVENLFCKVIVEVIMGIIFGINVKGKVEPFVKAAREFAHPELKSVIKLLLNSVNEDLHKVLNLNTISKSLYEFFADLVEINMKHKKTDNDINDLFSFFSKVNKGEVKGIDRMSTDEMIGQTFIFFIGGQDSTTSTVSLTLYELAKNSKLQSKIRKEVEEILHESEGMSYEAITKMKSLENAINETLRMHPVLGLIKRVCTKDYRLDEKVIIPKGMDVIIPVRAFHYDPSFFKDPYLYNPDRFLEEPPLNYMPFGKGQRSCLGMRLAKITARVILASFLINFEVEPSPKMIEPLTYDPQTIVITNRAVGGVWLRLKKRT